MVYSYSMLVFANMDSLCQCAMVREEIDEIDEKGSMREIMRNNQ